VGFAKDFQGAFQSLWAQVGILLSAIALFNFLARLLNIGLSDLLVRLTEAFRAVFHPVVDFFLGWRL